MAKKITITKKTRAKKPKFKGWKKGARKRGVSRGMLSSFTKEDPFPPMCMKKMVYSGSFEVGVNSLTQSFDPGYRFKLNSPYDPYDGILPSTLNTSAYGWTEMAALYNRYKVFGVNIEVTFFDPDSDYMVCGILILNPANSALTLAGQPIAAIARRPQGWQSAIVNSGEQRKIFKQYMPMHKAFNLTKAQYANDIDNTTGSTTSDPATKAYIDIGCADNKAAGVAKKCQFIVRLTYFTQFYQRKIYT